MPTQVVADQAGVEAVVEADEVQAFQRGLVGVARGDEVGGVLVGRGCIGLSCSSDIAVRVSFEPPAGAVERVAQRLRL